LPQQEPGPAQPAWPGREPQQPWSVGPGNPAVDLPVSVLVADKSFSAAAPHFGQVGVSSAFVLITSPLYPQAGQLMS
jgi:hypothetical protein